MMYMKLILIRFFINLNNIKLYIPLNLLILNPNYKNK
jgi:hypothetical protein